MKKTIYEAPSTQILKIRVAGSLLIGSVETMNVINGTWDEEDI